MLIPRIFHQIWVGADPMPAEFRDYQQSWLDHNPGWELRLWTEDDLPEGAPAAVYERDRVPAERSDILRLELLRRHGGVYTDSDFECIRPIEPLLENAQFFAGYRKPGRVNNALLGSVPGHPILELALERCRPTADRSYDKAATGPEMLDTVIEGRADATLVDQSVLYPRTARRKEGAYAIHHRARSWRSGEELQSSLQRAEKRLERAEQEAHEWKRKCRQAEAELARLRRRSPLVRLRGLIGHR